MTIPDLALQALTALGIQRPAGFDGTFATFGLLSPADRIRVTNYSTAFVRANPQMFAQAEVDVALRFDPVSAPVDDSFDFAEFFGEVADNTEELVVAPVVNVGRSASYLAGIVPAVLVAVAVWWVWKNLR